MRLSAPQSDLEDWLQLDLDDVFRWLSLLRLISTQARLLDLSNSSGYSYDGRGRRLPPWGSFDSADSDFHGIKDH